VNCHAVSLMIAMSLLLVVSAEGAANSPRQIEWEAIGLSGADPALETNDAGLDQDQVRRGPKS
jgi:hypothetical protein